MMGEYSEEEEIEITPQMIEAGIAAVRSVEFELWEQRTPDQLATLAVSNYRAMTLV